MARVGFDYENLVAVEGGISENELSEIRLRLERALEDHLEDPPGFTRLPYTRELLEDSRRVADEVRSAGATDFILIGIGGSALGPIALQRALQHPQYNQLQSTRGSSPRIHFAENPDPSTLRGILDAVDLENTYINVVNKSGSTAETMANFLVLRQALIESVGKEGYRERTIFTTDPEGGYLRQIADREGIKELYIPQDVGGRYSVLTPVGLLPALVCGLDAEALLAGAAQCAGEMSEQQVDHPAIQGAAMHYLMDSKRGRNVRVMMPYADALDRLADWFVQLWAESLGKDGKGSTPLGAVGSTDQHSQLQLYMEGPQDKVIEFIKVEDHPGDMEIPRAYEDLEGIGYLGGHKVSELLNIECDATRKALADAGRPNCSIRLSTIDEDHLGYLIYALEVQTALAGALYEVNAFDQPGVEASKKITYSRMGRPGY